MAEPDGLLEVHALDWVAQCLGVSSRRIGLEPIAAASSSNVYTVSHRDDGAQEWVLRLFTNREWLAAEPDVAVHEGAALQEAARAGIVVPDLIALDETGASCGVPAVLMTRLPGRVWLQPDDLDGWIDQLAAAIRPLHKLDGRDFPWQRRPNYDVDALSAPDWTGVPQLWGRAFAHLRENAPATTVQAFIHRDYHPTNVLWQGDTISGIVDWVYACYGPIGIDIAHCRTNLSGLYGVQAADRFLSSYSAEADGAWRYDPYWDLSDLCDMLPCFPAPPEAWRIYGVRSLNETILRHRLDAYLDSVMDRL